MLLYCILLVCMVEGVQSGCDPNYGPAGTTECVSFKLYYNQYQWATCLTNKYIQQKSNHKHICINRYATYCYYQCMIEVHNKESGTVSKDCACTPGQPTGSPSATPTTLPPQCFSPSGATCEWYRNCLEKKYPCEDTTNAYAIRYAEKFCNMYNKNRYLFSSKGQQWVDAVRKCLQVSLVPLLRPWRSPSCQEIRRAAFDSHTPCYLRPDKGAPSVCDLECLEFFKIFFTIKGSFVKLDTAGESLKGAWNILNQCGLKCTYNWFRQSVTIRMVKIYFKLITQKTKRLFKRSSEDPLPEDDKQSRFAEEVVTYISNALKWNPEVMDWFSFSNTNSSILYVALADKKGLGIVQTSTPAVNLNNTIAGLATAIKESHIPVQVNGSNVWLKSLDSCSDKTCSQPRSLAISEKPPKFPSSGGMLVKSGYFVGTTFLVNSLILWWPNNPF
ncbi:uncharacterized protein LOC110243329 [Exaiptasia diaphana]|uniref:Uncharacterized protein n=1 Tax=Exaiptasia diaphana TaxID=2652724 RepID=A0A913XIZ7_EXADI|nr:uncharacterized protein LOC110243329 [Exaiptasia diaphana]KXJ11702.1 hypothetical protein AC249_AIPGENE10747 [Exaiptasia diaphana]